MNFTNYQAINRLLRVHNAARILRCSTRTVRRRIENHEIPATRIGRRAWGIRFSDLSRSCGDEVDHARD